MKEENLQEKLSILEQENGRLRKELAFYKSALDALENPIFIKNDELRYVFFNRSYKEFFKLEEGQYIGDRVEDLPYLSKEDKEKYGREDKEMLETCSVIQYETTFEDDTEGLRESLYWSKGFLSEEIGAKGVIGEIVNISSEKRLQRELRLHVMALEDMMRETKETSKIDPLTDIYNRRALEDLSGIMTVSKKDHRALCFLIADIDDFKTINDMHGHLSGDDVLKSFAAVMKRSFRQSDYLIRYGGDEFCVVLVGTGISNAKNVAERFLDSVRREVVLPDGTPLTVSIGVSQMQEDDDLMKFISRSDEALYKAKSLGKNRVVASGIKE